MKFYRFSIILLFIIILSAGVVCAHDVNETSAIDEDMPQEVEINEEDAVSSSEGNSFTDLWGKIDDSNDTLDLDKDYKYDSQKDEEFKDGFVFRDVDYTINGNNYVIDGNSESKMFVFINSNVVIKNLVIKNSFKSSFIVQNTTLVTDNVTFENCHDMESGAALWMVDSKYKSNNDKFIDNNAQMGSAIYLRGCDAEISNGVFTSKNPNHWGMIYSYNSLLYVEDSIFANSTSQYATAIYATGKTYVINTLFTNLFANKTGGAIGVKSAKYLYVQDCNFTNVSASKNGGAIFADITGDDNTMGTVTINRTLFEGCSAEFGGACLQLGGYLNIIYSKLINNSAVYNGGAVFSSNSTVYIAEDLFENNTAGYQSIVFNGGALYIDNGDLEVEYNDFIGNSAYNGGAIYVYDSYYEISHSLFRNNVEAIYSVFDRKKSIQKENNFSKDSISLNNVNYATNVIYEGKNIVLNPVYVSGNATDSYFDLRDWNLVTPVKDQGSMGACWAFGATGALESAFLKATNITIDISEDNIQNSMLKYSIYGEGSSIEEGTVTSGLAYYLSWLGVLPVEYDSYDELGKISPVIFTEDNYHIVDALVIPALKDVQEFHLWKEALVNYGALAICLNGADGSQPPYYNNQTASQYCNVSKGDHIVTLVGWNDTFSKDNFLITPPGDGAWICKNSWGTNWGDDGYFYVSYYDASLYNQTAVGYIINNTVNYNKLYQHDIGRYNVYYSSLKGDPVIYMNTYESLGEDLISAVGTYFINADEDYNITICVKDTEVYRQSGKSPYAGYHTIKLDKPILINEGETFTVKIQTLNIPVLQDTRQYFMSGSSIINIGGEIEDISANGEVACIKVYTLPNNNAITKNLVKNYLNDTPFVAFVKSGDSVIFEFNNTNTTVTSVDGKAIFNVDLKPGIYPITTYYNDLSIVNTIEILSSVDIARVVEIGYNADLTIDAKFLDSAGNGLNHTNVTVSLDNSTPVIFETSDDGIVPLKVSDLSMGDHSLKLYNPVTGENAECIIQVLSRFAENKDQIMYYNEGKSFDVRIRGDDGQFVGEGEVVRMTIAGKTYLVKTDDEGYASLPINLSPKTWIITLDYAGETVQNVITVKDNSKIVTNNLVMSYKDGSYFKATIYKSNGKRAGAGEVVKMTVAGKTYTVKTDKNGVAKLQINLKAKTYDITTSYLRKTVKNTITVKDDSKIVSSDVVIKYKSASSFKATIYKSNGKRAGAGEVVKMTVAGKTYTVITDKNGVAQLPINLKPNKYTIITQYLAKTVKNIITVK